MIYTRYIFRLVPQAFCSFFEEPSGVSHWRWLYSKQGPCSYQTMLQPSHAVVNCPPGMNKSRQCFSLPTAPPSRIQSIDKGIIMSTKRLYRRKHLISGVMSSMLVITRGRQSQTDPAKPEKLQHQGSSFQLGWCLEFCTCGHPLTKLEWGTAKT